RFSPMAARFCSGTEKATEIGVIWLMTTRGVTSLALTRLPAATRRFPVRPSIGETIVVNPSWSSAVRTAARSAATVPPALATSVRNLSSSSAGIAAVPGGGPRQLSGPVQDQLGPPKQCQVAIELGLGLVEGGLVRARVDGEELVALLDVFALGKVNGGQLTADARADGDRRIHTHGANGPELHRHSPDAGLCHGHGRRGRWGGRWRRFCAPRREGEQANAGAAGE